MKQTEALLECVGLSMKRLGIIGGLGPETSCKFCLNINTKLRELKACQPDIVMENIPVSLEAEKKIVNGVQETEHLGLILRALEKLNKADVDIIAIPCNTVHVFLPELRELSKAPILSIMEECAKVCEKMGLKKVGLLASATTIKAKLHGNELNKQNIAVLVPSEADQNAVNRIILKITNGIATESDKKGLLAIIDNMKNQGAEAVILGCTDLQLLVSKASLPLIDTCTVLENAVVQLLAGDKHGTA